MSLPTKHPMDWKRKTLSNTLSVLKDGTHFSPKAFGGRNLYITSKNIRMGKLDLEDVSYIPDEEHQRIYSTSPVKYGDVLLTKDGAKTGNVCINTLHEEFSLLSSVAYLRGKTDLLLNEFLVQWLSSPRVQYDIKNDMAGQAITRLTLQKIGKLKILLPPLPEQKAIADLLSTWDEAIEKTERLIQAKEANLTDQVQRLISQRCDSWPHMRPKKIFATITERNFPDEELLSVTQDRGVIPRSMLEGRVMSPDGTTANYKLIKQGDFAISLRSFQGGIEYSNYQGIISPAYTVLRPKIELNSDFYRLFFKSYIFIKKYLSLAVIGIRDGKQVSIPDFMSIKIPVPPLEEQKKIADTLSILQHEIDLLKQLADKYRTQKRGLMQKLLTGEWRTKPEIISQYS